jgi:hypothetical protein
LVPKTSLCDPEQGLAIGCKVLRKKLDRLLELLVPAIITATFLITWRAEHQDRAKLAADLATAQ